MKRPALLALAFVACALLLTNSRPAAALSSGSLIKGSGSTLYYYAEDGKRHVFPTEKVYRSWYADFSGITQLTDAALAGIELGPNVTYHPGTRMVKVQTDPRVYAIAKGGVLRWVASEDVARQLYGTDWNTKIDDIPDAFFFNYMLGADINSASDFDVNAARNVGSINEDFGGAPPSTTPPPTTTPPPGNCTADTWSCTDWDACPAGGTQTRSCTMTSDCAGVTTPSPATSQSCTPSTTTPPPTTCTADTWSCTDWNACSSSGTQSRTCIITSECSSVSTPSPVTSQSCTPPTTTPPPTNTSETVDLITDNGFESSVGGFAPLYTRDGSVEQTTVNPIAGAKSLHAIVKDYGRVAMIHDYAWDSGPIATSVTAKAKVRIDSASPTSRKLQICSLVYYQNDSNPRSKCQDLAAGSSVIDVNLALETTGQKILRAFFQLKLDADGTINATLDDAHLYVTKSGSSTTPPPASCSADAWSCTDWNACSSSGGQTRACIMTYDCATATTPSPATTQSCTPPTTTPPPSSCTADTWSCGSWGSCSTSGSQSRSCTRTYDCPSVSTPSPATTQSCTPPTTPPPSSCSADTWSCGGWGSCSTSGSQTRTCTRTFDCTTVTTPSPATTQSCTPSSTTPPPPTNAAFTVILTDSGSTSPLPVIADAQDPVEPNLTPAFHVSVPNAQCSRMVNFVNPAIAIPTTSRIRQVEAYWNGTPLPLIDPRGSEVAEEAHSYGSMIGFFKPLFSLSSVPGGSGSLEIKAFDGNHQQITSAVIPNLTNVKAPTPLSASQMAAQAHPRLYLTPSRLAEIKAKPATDLTVKRFWSETDGVGYFLKYYTTSTDPESSSFQNQVYDPENYIPALALCYQLTKDSDTTKAAKCADAAKKLTIAISDGYASGTRSFSRDYGYDIRFQLRDMMLAYDWMYDQFTPAQRTQIAKVSTDWVDWFATGGYARTLPVENYYAGYLQALTLVPIATAGDNAQADRLMTVLRKKLVEEVPVLNQRGCGGDFAEGWNYGPYTMVEFALVNQSLKDIGEDWSADFDFVQPLARSFIYQVTPDNMMTVPFGDYSGNFGHMTRPSLLAVLSGTTSDGALASRLYSAMAARPTSDFYGGLDSDGSFTANPDRGGTFYEMTFGKVNQSADVSSMPLSYLNPGTGRWFSKSSLTDTSGYEVTSEVISYDGDHYGFANGDVQLFHGSTCILCSSAYRGYPFYGLGETKMYSTYVVNGRETANSRNAQVLFSKDAGTWSAVGTRFEASYAPSRFDENMMSSAMPLDYLIRETVHVRPGVLVVRDLHRRRHTSDTLVANWHLGSTAAVQTLGAGRYKLGTTDVTTFTTAATAFSNDNGPGGARLGTLMTQTFPAGTDRTETLSVFSEGVTGVSYTGGVLKLSNNQCVTFSDGGVNVANCQ